MTVSKYIFLRKVDLFIENLKLVPKNVLLSSFCWIFAAVSVLSQSEYSIGEIQGDASTSAFVGQEVIINDAVILLKSSGETIVQSAKGFEDGNASTSDAIVLLGTINAPLGSSVQLRGTIVEFDGRTSMSSPTIVTVDDMAKPSPDPIDLDAFFSLKENWSEEDLEALEFMRIDFQNGNVCQAGYSTNFLNINLTEKRPQREPGIDGNSINGLPDFDQNIEILRAYSLGQDFDFSVPAGSSLEGSGYFFQEDEFYFLLLSEFTLNKVDPVQKVTTAEEDFSLATCNLLFFDAAESNFIFRREKIANYILEGLNAPDIIALQEVANLATLKELAEDLNELQNEKEYRYYLEQGNNSSSINLGFLVSQRIIVESIEQLGENQSLSIGGSMHDRPPFLLKGMLNTNPRIPIQVLNLHIRSLSGIAGSNGDFVRIKRAEQAKSIERMIDNLWDENLFVLGDLNAYQFSDGYVDVYRQIAGGVSEGALIPITSPAENELQSITTDLPSSEKYSFVFNGNTQQLDHILYSELENLTLEKAAFYRGNCDAPSAWLNQVVIEGRNSDHDGLLGSFEVEYPWSNSSTPVIEIERPAVNYNNPFSPGDFLRFSPSESDIFTFSIYDLMGRKLYEEKSSFVKSDEQWEIAPTKIDYEGMLLFEITGEDFRWVSKVFYAGSL